MMLVILIVVILAVPIYILIMMASVLLILPIVIILHFIMTNSMDDSLAASLQFMDDISFEYINGVTRITHNLLYG